MAHKPNWVFVLKYSEEEMFTINEQNLIDSHNTVPPIPHGLNVANQIGIGDNFNFNNL